MLFRGQDLGTSGINCYWTIGIFKLSLWIRPRDMSLFVHLYTYIFYLYLYLPNTTVFPFCMFENSFFFSEKPGFCYPQYTYLFDQFPHIQSIICFCCLNLILTDDCLISLKPQLHQNSNCRHLPPLTLVAFLILFRHP